MRRSRPLTHSLENKKEKKKTGRRYPFLARELLLQFPQSSGRRRTLTPVLWCTLASSFASSSSAADVTLLPAAAAADVLLHLTNLRAKAEGEDVRTRKH